MSVQELFKKYEEDINKHDFELMLPLLSRDCKFWFTSGTYEGLDQSRVAFEKTWKMIEEEVYRLSDVIWIIETDHAAVSTYTYHWKGLIGGKPSEGQGRGTSCFRREVDGWRIVHEHLSNFPK